MMMEMLNFIYPLLLAALGYFLKSLHEDHAEVKKRLMAMEVEQAVQKNAHSNMSEKLQELHVNIKEMPKALMDMLSPYFKALDEKIAHEKK